MIWAPRSSRMSCDKALTEATVPTGMNTGVSISACGVTSFPRRAVPAVFSMQKDKDIQWDCSNRGVGDWGDDLIACKRNQYRYRSEFRNRNSSFCNLDDFSADVPIVNRQLSDGDRQFESPRPGTAGVEVEHSATSFELGNMAMSGDDDTESGGFR